MECFRGDLTFCHVESESLVEMRFLSPTHPAQAGRRRERAPHGSGRILDRPGPISESTSMGRADMDQVPHGPLPHGPNLVLIRLNTGWDSRVPCHPRIHTDKAPHRLAPLSWDGTYQVPHGTHPARTRPITGSDAHEQVPAGSVRDPYWP